MALHPEVHLAKHLERQQDDKRRQQAIWMLQAMNEWVLHACTLCVGTQQVHLQAASSECMSDVCVHSVVSAHMLKNQLASQLAPIHCTHKDHLIWRSCWAHADIAAKIIFKSSVLFW